MSVPTDPSGVTSENAKATVAACAVQLVSRLETLVVSSPWQDLVNELRSPHPEVIISSAQQVFGNAVYNWPSILLNLALVAYERRLWHAFLVIVAECPRRFECTVEAYAFEREFDRVATPESLPYLARLIGANLLSKESPLYMRAIAWESENNRLRIIAMQRSTPTICAEHQPVANVVAAVDVVAPVEAVAAVEVVAAVDVVAAVEVVEEPVEAVAAVEVVAAVDVVEEPVDVVAAVEVVEEPVEVVAAVEVVEEPVEVVAAVEVVEEPVEAVAAVEVVEEPVEEPIDKCVDDELLDDKEQPEKRVRTVVESRRSKRARRVPKRLQV